MNSEMLPKVTIVTPVTFSRARFIEIMKSNVYNQDYPHERITWLVVGDTDTRTRELFESAFRTLPSITCKYMQCNIEGDLGKKRNFSCSHVSTNIIANMDSDDVYNKTYLSYSISIMKKNKMGIVGCRDMLIFFPQYDGKMTMIRGSSIHEATMVCTRKHWKNFKYASGMSAEGAQMVDGKYLNELDIRRVMICLAHDSNTFDKKQFLESTEVELSDHQRNGLIESLKMLTN